MTKTFLITKENSKRHIDFIQKNKNLVDDIVITNAIMGKDMPYNLVEGIFSNSFINHQKKTQKNYSKWISGTFGCFLSHIKCFEQIANLENDHGAFICEDDAKITQKIDEIRFFLEEKKPDLLFISNRMSKSKQTKNDNEDYEFLSIKKHKFTHGTGAEAYYISKKASNYILDFLKEHKYTDFPSGFDGFLQSLALSGIQLSSVQKPGIKSIIAWQEVHKITLDSYILDKGIAIHDDNNFSLIEDKQKQQEK